MSINQQILKHLLCKTAVLGIMAEEEKSLLKKFTIESEALYPHKNNLIYKVGNGVGKGLGTREQRWVYRISICVR